MERSLATVSQSPLVKCFYSKALNKNLQIRRLKANYYIVNAAVIDPDSLYVEILAETEVRQKSVSVHTYDKCDGLMDEIKSNLPKHNYWITGELCQS